MLTNSYVAVDLETTGLSAKTEKIIEIAAVKVVNGCIAEEKTILINPGRKLSTEISKLTGISDDMLEKKPMIGQVIGEYAEFCEGLPLLGHNILFDYSFLKRAAVNAGLNFEKEGLDTLRLCRKFMPEKLSKSLGSACSYFQVSLNGAHRALHDARAAHELYQILINRYGDSQSDIFSPQKLVYKVKKEQSATKRQKEVLHELTKYHKINLTVQVDCLSRNEISRLTDKIISQYGRIVKR